MNYSDYRRLPTEKENPKSRFLDRLSIESALLLMNREDRKVPLAVAKEIKNIGFAVRLIVKVLQNGGKIFFVGAGTSGRLGVMESAELPPTFDTHPKLFQALMAGGRKAVFYSQEGAEDNATAAKRQIDKKVKRGDVVIGIAASGVTPFVQSALTTAKKKKAYTILITCNANTKIRKKADVVIAPAVGPEMIAGSTRLKSGTATKLVLNMLTTTSMVQMGKVYGNKMVDLQPKSRKLRERGIRLIQELAGVSRTEAMRVFQLAKRRVKVAILMAKKKLSFSQAQSLLEKNQGFLTKSL